MKFSYIFNLIIFLTLFSCSNSSDLSPITDDDEPNNGAETPTLTEEVKVYNKETVYKGLVLAIENGGLSTSLVTKEGTKVKTWNFEQNLGNDLEILPNGNLFGIFKAADPHITYGGYGGNVKIINTHNETIWNYVNASENEISHHDIEMLPNGNVLILIWEKITAEVARQNGVNANYDIFPEKLIEVNPATNQIVWEWRSWEHIIQDFDSNSLNYGNVSENPQLIDINYSESTNGDIMHANGIDFDPVNNVIFISINFYSEVWVIDHSTTTQEAASNKGGNYNKGGDLIYRFGNPSAYNNPNGDRILYNNHFPNFLQKGEIGEGNMLIYNNGANVSQSTVFEVKMPTNYELTPNALNEPTIVWSFTNPELFHGKLSGAVRLKNGNTLICEGDYGFWEVTPSKEIAWKYAKPEIKFWRGYNYDYHSAEISSLGLEF